MKVDSDKNTSEPPNMGAGSQVIIFIAIILIALTFPISLWFCIKIVVQYQRAIIFRLGRIIYKKPQGPGVFFVIPLLDNFKVVDLRTRTFDVAPQTIITKDSVTVLVDAVVYYKITNPQLSVTRVENVQYSTQLLASTYLRNILGVKTLAEILSDRENIAADLRIGIDAATDPWGVYVEHVEIKDILLPRNLQRSMAAEAEATRDARAKIISAQGEEDASRALRDAADQISESPAALQLKYLNTLVSMSSEKNNTIVFPLPVKLIQQWLSK